MSGRHEAWTVPISSRAWPLALPLAVCAATALVLLLTGTVPGRALGGEAPAATDFAPWPAQVGDEPTLSCLQCHRNPDLTMTFPSGETLSLYVDAATYDQSVHGDKLYCVNCHESNRRYPHPLPEVQSHRDYTLAQYEVCKRCHFENYTRTLDSIHYEAMKQGQANAPVCTDCHTAHAVSRLEESRTEIAGTCAKCHQDVYEAYAESVHGSALWKENPDVPVCTTCHGVHNITGATTPSFHLGSVELCAECHANKELMDEYGISSAVLKTYLNDFHGKTVGFYQRQSSEVWPDVAICTDCHGVHDIKPVDSPDSPVVKQNLVNTCRQCHPDATANFPSAWLSHYEPSLDKATLVYLVKQYYRFLIPLMVGGLALNIVLDLWRLARNR